MVQESNDRPVVHIVDDDESLRASLDSLFRSAGIQTRTYGSASEFVDAARTDAPGCIVLDVRLPGTSGLDFQDQLTGLGIRFPVILLPAHRILPMPLRPTTAAPAVL